MQPGGAWKMEEVAGSEAVGQSLVVWAISEGRQAARAVDEDLRAGRSAIGGPGGLVPPVRV